MAKNPHRQPLYTYLQISQKWVLFPQGVLGKIYMLFILSRRFFFRRVSIAQSVEHLPGLRLGDSGTHITDPGLKSHECLFTIKWMRIAQLPCWLPRSQQVSHQKWIWGLHCMQATKHACKGIHPGRCHQNSKTGVSVAPQKGLTYFNFFFKKGKENVRFLFRFKSV